MFGYERRNIKAKQKAQGKWSKSVAELMEEQGKFIPNEKLSKQHQKIKNPEKFNK